MHPFIEAAKNNNLEVEEKKKIIRNSIESAMIYSIFEKTCKENNIDPWEAVRGLTTGLIQGAEFEKEVDKNTLHPEQATEFKKLISEELDQIEFGYIQTSLAAFFRGE